MGTTKVSVNEKVTKPRLSVHKFSSCDGCQLSLIHSTIELLELSELVELKHFAEAGALDEYAEVELAIIEGSVNTKHDIERLKKIREISTYVVAMGACATSGGIQALRNFTDEKKLHEWSSAVYKEHTEVVFKEELPTALPISSYVKVDYEIRGCPAAPELVFKDIRQLLFGAGTEPIKDPVCITCKKRGLTCVMVAFNEPCLGPVTQDGCNALCPQINRGCYGCYGPSQYANLAAQKNKLKEMGLTDRQIEEKFKFINSHFYS